MEEEATVVPKFGQLDPNSASLDAAILFIQQYGWYCIAALFVLYVLNYKYNSYEKQKFMNDEERMKRVEEGVRVAREKQAEQMAVALKAGHAERLKKEEEKKLKKMQNQSNVTDNRLRVNAQVRMPGASQAMNWDDLPDNSLPSYRPEAPGGGRGGG